MTSILILLWVLTEKCKEEFSHILQNRVQRRFTKDYFMFDPVFLIESLFLFHFNSNLCTVSIFCTVKLCGLSLLVYNIWVIRHDKKQQL